MPLSFERKKLALAVSIALVGSPSSTADEIIMEGDIAPIEAEDQSVMIESGPGIEATSKGNDSDEDDEAVAEKID